jgi:hypothetical protein
MRPFFDIDEVAYLASRKKHGLMDNGDQSSPTSTTWTCTPIAAICSSC